MKTNIKNLAKTVLLFSIFFSQFSANAQAPNKFSYQAVVRNASNVIVASAPVGMRVSILQTTATGTAVYVETHNSTTNANGLAAIEIGGGTLVSGNFGTIDWANGPYFVKTDTDPAGGTSYSITGTSQLLSVPYALNAKTAATAVLATNATNAVNATNATNAVTATNATNAWSKSGNSATATDFIGTTNDQDVVFKRNNQTRGKIDINFQAFGIDALSSITAGSSLGNNAFGNTTLNILTSGDRNSAFGSNVLLQLSTGSNNTGLGSLSLSNLTTGSNNTGLGNNAQVPTLTGNNQVRIGNTAVTYAGVQVAWTITSDKRWKSNIVKSNLGLDFIKQLQPVSYTRKDVEVSEKGTKILETTTNPTVEYGFIAQELEATLNKFNTKNNGIIYKDDAGMYGVRYNDLLAPMVKAMQELDAKRIQENEALQQKINTLTEKLNLVLNQVEVLKKNK